MKILLAVDPGDITGVAWWNIDTSEASLLGMKQIPLEELPALWEFLDVAVGVSHIDTVVVEDFVLFGQRAQSQTGSRMKASQGIGMVKALAHMSGSTVVVQKASIKSVALKWSQIKMPKQHSKTHEWDAFLHGYYWLVQQGLAKTALQLEKEK